MLVTGEIVSWLDEKFGDDLRRVHLMDLPGARRTGERVDKGTLQEYMSLEGREKTLQQFIYWAAIMFRRWCLRGGNDSTEYYRGLSQELFVSFPGAGAQELYFLVRRSKFACKVGQQFMCSFHAFSVDAFSVDSLCRKEQPYQHVWFSVHYCCRK